ncbi:MAG: ABC transporter permease [Gemmataceae bacterium]
MSSKAVKEKRDPHTPAWQPPRESAPSEMKADEPTFPRVVGMGGVFLVTIAVVVFLVSATGRTTLVPTFWAIVCLVVGIAGLLFHAANETDLQIRRSYGVLGYLWLITGVLVSALPMGGAAGDWFLPYGFMCLTLGLFFLLPFAHIETDPSWRNATIWTIGGVGVVLAATGFIGGNVSQAFLLPYGLVLALLGLGYLWAFVGVLGVADDVAFKTGNALGVVGFLVFLVALGRSALPNLFYSWGWLGTRPDPYLIPSGLLLIGLGFLYLLLAAAICSDNPLIVMTRRELAAFFFSPVAYIVFFGLSVTGLIQYMVFISQFLAVSLRSPAQIVVLNEPIVVSYFIDWVPAVAVTFAVPVFTMRLLSEEKRTGTLEVMLTAPITETQIVLSKFFAVLFFFLFAWLPWGLYLIAFRVEAGHGFEYRPLLTFFIALSVSGAGFLSMGLFFSSLTRNQIAAAVLTFVGMLLLIGILLIRGLVEFKFPGSVWVPILTHVSYWDFWNTAMQGLFAPRYIVFHLSATVFWLYLTVKVLEARKWS